MPGSVASGTLCIWRPWFTFKHWKRTHLTTHCHNPIGPSLNYTAVETSDLPYLVAFKRLLIADSALFYPWPTVYKCCVLFPPLCFILGRLSTTAAYCWLRTVLSVTICVQLLLIADSALFHPWSSVCNCVAYCSLPFCFSVTIGVQLLLFADSVQFYPWQFVCTCRLILCAVATLTVIFIVAPCILQFHWVLHTNKCTNCILYISLKLYTLKHFHCSYMFR
jgi:hypothetical protein